MVDEKLVRTVQNTFSLYGLVLSRKLSISLAKQLMNVEENERITMLTQIIENILLQNLNDIHVTVENLKLAIEESVRPDTLKDTETVLNVIDAFAIPKVKYNLTKRKFDLTPVTFDLYADAQYRCEIFKNRFELLWYRTLRHKLFNPSQFCERKEDWIELVQIRDLLSESKSGNVHVMGLLTQLTEDQYYLEDTDGTIKVDLHGADSLIMEYSVVIVYGNYKDGVLHAIELGFPPVEESMDSREDFEDAKALGGSSLKLSEKLKIYEENNKNGMIVFVSELWLDDISVLKKFKSMLAGYAEYPPIAFVLCGHFQKNPTSVTSPQTLKQGLKDLCDLIQQYTSIKESSKFIFVPAVDDIGSVKIIPRSPLPKHLTEDFEKQIPGAIFTTNPCKIKYCTKEIVVIREDILSKMCRYTLKFPNSGNIYDHYAKCIISQSHLTPLSLSMVPIFWKYDHVFQLHPTPNLIVSADKFESYQTKYSTCHIINPGLFPTNDYSFKVYVPALDLIEHCAIPKEMDEL